MSAAGFVAANAPTIIEDFETLTVTIDGLPLREGGTTTATITRSNTDREEVVMASLANSDPSRLAVPQAVIIPAGQASTTFDITSMDDGLITGNQTLVVDVSADGYQPASFEIEVEDVPFPWQNPVLRTDVNDDGQLTPADILVLVNDLNRNGARKLPLAGPDGPPPYLDVNGDGFIAPNDVVNAVNEINRQMGSGAEGEGSIHVIDDLFGRFDFVALALPSSSVQEEMAPRRTAVTTGRDSTSPVTAAPRTAAPRFSAVQRSSLRAPLLPTQPVSETDEVELLLSLLAADVALQEELGE